MSSLLSLFLGSKKKNLFLNCEKEPEDILLIRKQKQEVLIPRCNLRVELTICVRKLALIRFVAMSGGPSVTTCVTFCPLMLGTDDRCFPETILTLSPCLQELWSKGGITCITFFPPMLGTDDSPFPETILTLTPRIIKYKMRNSINDASSLPQEMMSKFSQNWFGQWQFPWWTYTYNSMLAP